MLNIILAILASASVSITLKVADRMGHSGFAILGLNYIFATVIAFFNVMKSGCLADTTPIVIILGMITGFFYLATFLLCQVSIRSNGAVLTATFMKMGIIVPIILSQLVWNEKASPIQWAGIAVAVCGILFLTFDPSQQTESESTKKPMALLMLVILLSAGMGDAMAKFYNYYGVAAANDMFVFITFLTATVIALGMMVGKKEAINLPKIGLGAVLGAVNYGSAIFLLLALNDFASYVVYPMVNALTITTVALICIPIFREKLVKRQYIGLLLVLVAVVLLNL